MYTYRILSLEKKLSWEHFLGGRLYNIPQVPMAGCSGVYMGRFKFNPAKRITKPSFVKQKAKEYTTVPTLWTANWRKNHPSYSSYSNFLGMGYGWDCESEQSFKVGSDVSRQFVGDKARKFRDWFFAGIWPWFFKAFCAAKSIGAPKFNEVWILLWNVLLT